LRPEAKHDGASAEHPAPIKNVNLAFLVNKSYIASLVGFIVNFLE